MAWKFMRMIMKMMMMLIMMIINDDDDVDNEHVCSDLDL